MRWIGSDTAPLVHLAVPRAVLPVRRGMKKAGTLRPRLPFRFCVCDLVSQRTPGAAGKRIISVSVIDIEKMGLVVPEGARCANAFMFLTIAPSFRERNVLLFVTSPSVNSAPQYACPGWRRMN